jgi:hypothetical protein
MLVLVMGMIEGLKLCHLGLVKKLTQVFEVDLFGSCAVSGLLNKH